MNDRYDIVIIGGGVTGTALLYLLSRYTDVPRIALIEKEDAFAQVSSKATNNSQTLHFGDIETNYSLEKARKVKDAASLVARYVDALPDDAGVARKLRKMVLAVGEREIADLRERHATFRELFPTLRYVERRELEDLEPAVVEGRPEDEAIAALTEAEGYVVDYERLSASFAEKAAARRDLSSPDVRLGTTVSAIRPDGDGFVVEGPSGDIRARAVVVSAGAHSLRFAQTMGLAGEYAILPVAGDFYRAPNLLRGKVYRVQLKGLPFAAIHGDPDITDMSMMRFGPVPFAVPYLEPRNPASMIGFLRTFTFDLDTLKSMLRINTDPVMRGFIAKSIVYQLPFIGRRAVHKEARTIVPRLPLDGFEFGKDLGGVRPQLVHKKERRIHMGEAKFALPGVIFNVTPSPGASVCLANGIEDLRELLRYFDGEFSADRDALRADLGAEA